MYKLTKHDSDVMASMLFAATRMAERAVEVMEQYHEEAYITTKEYQQFEKRVGKLQARQYLHEMNKKVLRHDDKCRLSEWMEAAKRLHTCTDRLTVASMDTAVALTNNITADQMFDAVQEGAAILGRLFILIGNMEQDDIVKLESYAKLLHRHDETDLGLLDYFRPKV